MADFKDSDEILFHIEREEEEKLENRNLSYFSSALDDEPQLQPNVRLSEVSTHSPHCPF